MLQSHVFFWLLLTITSLITCLHLNSIRISNELGDGSAKAAYLAVKVTMFLGSAVGILEFAVLMLVRKVWGRAFTNIHEVATYVTAIIPIVASSAFIDSIQTAFQGVARGCDRQKLGALINLGSYYLLGVPFAIVTACVLHTKGQVKSSHFVIIKKDLTINNILKKGSF
ncbi:hypothetical protein AAZX31_09G161600 [Glycine max]